MFRHLGRTNGQSGAGAGALDDVTGSGAALEGFGAEVGAEVGAGATHFVQIVDVVVAVTVDTIKFVWII